MKTSKNFNWDLFETESESDISILADCIWEKDELADRKKKRFILKSFTCSSKNLETEFEIIVNRMISYSLLFYISSHILQNEPINMRFNEIARLWAFRTVFKIHEKSRLNPGFEDDSDRVIMTRANLNEDRVDDKCWQVN